MSSEALNMEQEVTSSWLTFQFTWDTTEICYSLDLSVSFEALYSKALLSLQAVNTLPMNLCLDHFSNDIPSS